MPGAGSIYWILVIAGLTLLERRHIIHYNNANPDLDYTY